MEVKILETKKEIVETNPSITKEEVITWYEAGNSYSKFIGGFEVAIEKLDEEVSFLEADEEGKKLSWKEYAGFKESLDGTKAIIHIGYPVGYKEDRCISWDSTNAQSFKDFSDELGIDNIMTKSEYKELLNSSNYKQETITEL